MQFTLPPLAAWPPWWCPRLEAKELIDGGEGIFVKTDVSNEDSVKGFVEKVKSYGRLNFNNAGVAEDPASFTDKTSSVFDKIMATNVKDGWLSMKHEIPQMLRNGGGAIVNTSSVYGVIGNPQPLWQTAQLAIIK